MSVQADLFEEFAKKLSSRNESMVVTDARHEDNPIIFCNKSFTDLTQYEPDEIVGKNCRFLQNDDTDQPEVKFLAEAIKDNRACTVILRNYKKNGELFWNELTLTPILDSEDEAKFFVGIQKDVTGEIHQREEIVEVFKAVFGLEGDIVKRGE